MKISKGIEIINEALWIKKENILVINDLHLGYEESLHRKGILVPKFQISEILKQFRYIFKKVSPKKIIINGDLKHEFGSVLKQEWKDVLQLLDFLSEKCKEIIIIQGNHDPIIKPIADKRNISIVPEFKVRNILIVHGNELVKTGKEVKTIIIGHEHPAVTIREGSKWEKYKCFLKGDWKENLKDNLGDKFKSIGKSKELIVVPSFNPLLEGTDILKEKLLSPFLSKSNLENFTIYVVGEKEVFLFGKVKSLR